MALVLLDPTSGIARRVQARPGPALRMYVCGPTVYDRAHVGHARNYLYFDIVRRHFEASGSRVRHVMNVTDLEEKVYDRARELGLRWDALARREERDFFNDLARLRVDLPHVAPRASDHVPEMVRVVRRLERTGRAHREDGRLVYEPADGPAEPGLPTLQDLARHAFEEPGHACGPEGEGFRKFVIWQPPHAGGPSWPSPWGKGTPGWHLECFTMARRYLGLPVDLHGGGKDLVFPHHVAENVIARALERLPFARRFLHTSFVTQDGEKMSKSVGNLVALRPVLASQGADALRWYLLSRPYETGLEWDERALARAAETHRLTHRTLRAAIPSGAGGTLPLSGLASLERDIAQEISANLGVDRALEKLRRYASRVGRARRPVYPRGSRREVRSILTTIERRLGLVLG